MLKKQGFGSPDAFGKPQPAPESSSVKSKT